MGVIIIGIVFMIISLAVSSRLKNKFKKYSEIGLASNLSGQQIAEKMLADNGIYDVRVVSVEGQLTDHYNPATKIVNLSHDVYYGRSAAAAAVAAHECGHAVQHATAYAFLQLRSALVPIQNVSATIINIMFMAMLFGSVLLQGVLPIQTALLVIIACYSVMTLFTLITLPVEFDASNRALAWIENRGIVTPREHEMAKDALKWAALTYVVAAVGSLVTLIYYILAYLGINR
ncbi:MAG: zinc metallopeptidase, partial [Chitinophagaceae bacterium]|nr:zinc metallopeptidase [Chitinophagaceae bacterium]